MSLQVWLPLNGDLNNYGVNNPVISGTAFYASDGKIGSKSLNTSNTITVNLPSIASSRIWSVTFWAYAISANITTNWTRVIRIADGGDMFRVEVCPSSYNSGQNCYLTHNNAAYKIAQGSVGSPSGGYYDQWFHMAITCDGTTISVYHNGTLRGTQNYTGDGTITGSFYLENNHITKKNDFRIYDHCLSPKEVKEISKGLVCHYPLDNNGSGMPNLVNGSNTNSVDTNGFGYSEQTGGSTRTIEYDGGIPCVKITRNSTAHSGWDYFWYNKLQASNLKENTTYTISFDAIGSGSGTIGLSGFLHGNGTNSITQSVATVSNSFNSNGWSHIHFITTTKASFDGISVGAQVVYMSCAFLRTVNTWIKLKNIRVTEGSNESPWSPSASDASYSIFNINGNKEIDISGYGNHGTKSGSLTTNSDTPKYSCATYFPSGSGIFAHPNINLTAFTISFWAKHTATGKMVFGSSSEPSSGDRNWYWYGDNSIKYPDGEFYYQHNAGSAESLLNKWTHFVAVYNGSTITVYRNSINEGNQAASGTKTLNYLSVGIGYGSSSYWENSTMSDFRLYATALSADDIKELYQVSASIDTKGNILGYDFQEV